MGPPHRLSCNLSAVPCFGINQTNPLINLKPLLDNSTIPLRVIRTNTFREGSPERLGSRQLLGYRPPHKNTLCLGIALLSSPTPRHRHRCWFPIAPQAADLTAAGQDADKMEEKGQDSLPSPSLPLTSFFHQRTFPFWVLLVCKSCHPSPPPHAHRA